MKQRTLIFSCILICIFALSFGSPATAATVGTFEELQIALAGDDPTIILNEGAYEGNLLITRSVELVASGDVTLTRPWTDYDNQDHDSFLIITNQGTEVENPEDTPIITVLGSGAVTLDGITFTQPVSGDLSGEYWQGEYTTIGILAGSGVDLIVNDCNGGQDFYAPVVVTTWEDVFAEALGTVNYVDIVGDLFTMSGSENPSSLVMTDCNFSDYEMAGVVILGDGVTAEMNNNTLNGNDIDERVIADTANLAMQEVAQLGLSAVSGNLFANSSLPSDGVGVLVVNSNDDQVIMKDNEFNRNLAGVAAIKEVSQSQNDSLVLESQASIEAGEGLSIESGNTFNGNMLGVVALGGLDLLLEWNVVSQDLLVSPDIAWGSTSAMPLFIQGSTFSNNIAGTILVGKVQATVDNNIYKTVSSDDFMPTALGLVGLGDLSDTYITDNEFNGIIGASMVFALQKADIEGALEELGYLRFKAEEDPFNIDQQGILTVSGNTIAGNGPIEGVHELIDDYFGLSPEGITQQAMALGQQTVDNGPLAILPSKEPGLEDISLAGIVLLDGARNINIDGNSIGGTLLGITGIDTGIVEDIKSINITDNTVSGNICGLTLLGAGELIVPVMLTPKEGFMNPENKLVLGDVSGNHFDKNHIGMISALSVEGEIHDNFFDENTLLGMAHIGVGEWLVNYIFEVPEIIISGDICPNLDINTNSITSNGTNPEDGPSILTTPILELDGITPAEFLCGGVLVIDAAPGVKLNNNNISGNGNFGVLATARALYDPNYLMNEEVESIDVTYTLDASRNWWGNASGPSSYAISDDVTPGADETFFLDPDNQAPADGNGDSLGSFLVGIDDTYYPFSLTEPFATSASGINVLFLEKKNIVKFSDWKEEPVEIGTSGYSGGGDGCNAGLLHPSLILLIAPLVLVLRKK